MNEYLCVICGECVHSLPTDDVELMLCKVGILGPSPSGLWPVDDWHQCHLFTLKPTTQDSTHD